MLTVWGRENSTNVKKVLWCAGELSLHYEHVNAGGSFGVVSDPDYRAMNPNGLVPCIRDGDFILWESNAIVRYLARQYGAAGLMPTDAHSWAVADKWMDWTSLSFAAPFRDMFWNIVRLPPGQRSETEIASGTERCTALMRIADNALGSQPFLSGTAFGMADIPLGCIAYAWFALPIERPNLRHLAAWYETLTERPAYRSAVMTPLT